MSPERVASLKSDLLTIPLGAGGEAAPAGMSAIGQGERTVLHASTPAIQSLDRRTQRQQQTDRRLHVEMSLVTGSFYLVGAIREELAAVS
jgi:hypothetical protein